MQSEEHEPATADYRQALAEGWLPIREVAKLTGVNPVTLRAWERRYGLLVPRRTAKGHRLYSSEQVERVRQALTWLERGVAVSKVRALLDDAAPAALPEDNSPWGELLRHCLEAVIQVDERRLDELFNSALAIYPAQTLCERLMLPLQQQLAQRWQGQFGSTLEHLFYHSWLRSKLGSRLYHYNRQQHGAPLLLINQSANPLETGHWLCAWLASSAGCPVRVLDGPLPIGELTLAEERLLPRALLLYSDQSLPPAQLNRLLADKRCPVILAGAAVTIHFNELADLRSNGQAELHLAEAPLQARSLLQDLGLLHGGPA
ncbi:MerR family transcriptional regulator [Pseudomonas knackmussii]|uniref:MerR family transcriptional regulator n=1 Tax=Pseudomonas knackmussii TaxID=65741 RepID=UPI0013633A6D|nr:MerR family transcriptional regulator [Pseudomonas knackmussii]